MATKSSTTLGAKGAVKRMNNKSGHKKTGKVDSFMKNKGRVKPVLKTKLR